MKWWWINQALEIAHTYARTLAEKRNIAFATASDFIDSRIKLQTAHKKVQDDEASKFIQRRGRKTGWH